MADEATTQVSTDTSAEQPAVDSQSNEQTTQSDAGDTQSQDQGTEQSQTSDTESKADPASTDDKSKVETQDPKPESKPLSRRSAQFRIQQLVQENTELKKQLDPQKQDDWEDEGASDEVKPDISALVAKEVERRLNPVMSQHSKDADNAEIKELFSGDRADDKPKYEDKIREMWNLPQYKDVAAIDLYKIARYDELQASIPTIQQQAVEDYKKAQIEAKESSASGNSNQNNRTGKGGKSVVDMTSEEFQNHNEQVKAQL